MTALLPGATDWLARLVAHPTVTFDSNLALIDMLAGDLAALGARVRRVTSDDGQRANLFATFGPDGDGGIVLAGHTDVVPVEGQDWTSDPYTMRAEGGRLYGRGTCDMKGFIACCMAVAPQLAEARLSRPIHFAFTYDEEIGCFGATRLVAELARDGPRPAMAIVGEPTSMRVIVGHKGDYEYTTRFAGLEGHGSAPDRGVNAVEFAARYIGHLLETAEALKARAPADSPFDPPWTTLQVGRIAGGIARNVIPGSCEIDWEIRPVVPEDADFVKDRVAHYCAHTLLPAMQAVAPAAGIETKVVAEVAGLVPATVNEARDIVHALTGQNDSGVVSFATEAGIFQSLGLSVVICGPGSIDQAHKPDEFIEKAEMTRALDLLTALVGKFSD
jgi:acetylornithine deacetylase